MKALLAKGHEHIDRDRHPDLGLHRILGGAVKPGDAEMLLDPLEKQLDLPAGFVQRTDRGWSRAKEVGQEDQRLLRGVIAEAYAAQLERILLVGGRPRQHHGLVAENALRAVARSRIESAQFGIRFGAGDKERPGLLQGEEASEIQIGAVHDVNRGGFGA